MSDLKPQLETADCQPSEPKLKIHNFTENICDVKVHFHVMKLADSFFLWIGTESKIDNLAMAMATKFSSSPVSTTIMGEITEESSSSLAQKLARKTGKQAFVSWNLNADLTKGPLVEKRVFEELKANPDMF